MARPNSRRTVLAYAEAHPDEVSYLSARELGERCGVSESTVIRAIQAHGFTGYPDYQRRLRRELDRRRTTVERFSACQGTDPLARVFARDIENLRTTWENLSPAAFERAAELLATCPRVWLLGLRTPHAVAVFLGEALGFIGIDARLLTPGTHDLWDDLEKIAPGDAVVAITFPRYTRAVVEGALLARKRGCRLVALTDGPASPLAAHADAVLAAAYALEGYVESFTASMSVAQALVLETSRKLGRRALDALRRKEALWAERGVYWE